MIASWLLILSLSWIVGAPSDLLNVFYHVVLNVSDHVVMTSGTGGYPPPPK